MKASQTSAGKRTGKATHFEEAQELTKDAKKCSTGAETESRARGTLVTLMKQHSTLRERRMATEVLGAVRGTHYSV